MSQPAPKPRFALLPRSWWGPLRTLVLAYLTCVMSNFMSNTAAANILVPIALTIGGGAPDLVVPIALAASTAMMLPVSTPPNAIAFSTGNVRTADFVVGGAIVGLLGPALATLWSWWIMAG